MLATAASAQYSQSNLVSDGSLPANFIDPELVNPWGLAASPTGAIWIADNGTGLSTLYQSNGAKIGLTVSTQDDPDGIVFNGAGGFDLASGASSVFLFASETGMISGWAGGTSASILFDESGSGASYKGLGIIGQNIYAANFGTGNVDEFNGSTGFVNSFTDSSLTPLGYAPFGIQAVGSDLFVTYALVGSDGDDVRGAGHGYIDEFDANGNLLQRVYSNGVLNSPWGMAIAPSDFGQYSNDLLVGNFGDGRINAFSTLTGAYLGTLEDDGKDVDIHGLWGLAFGNGAGSGPADTLYFTAGPNHENDGLYGSLTVAPGPIAGLPMLAGLGFGALRRRRR